MKKSLLSCLLFMLFMPFTAFSQWMIVDTLCQNDPFVYPSVGCNDWFMTKPDIGYVGYSVMEMWQTPHSAEVRVSYIGKEHSQYLFREQCIASGAAGLGIRNLRFISEQVGFFSQTSNSECNSAVYRTVNGHDFSSIGIQNSELTTFSSVNTGYFLHRAGYINMSGVLSRYRDGVIVNLKTFPGYPVLNSLYFVNDSVGFFSVDHLFQKSSDWGQTWIPIDTITGRVTVICFPSSLVGYIVKNDTSLYKTTDGGNSWTFFGTKPRLNSIDFINDTIGYAVGNNGLILHTKDGAQSWVVEPCPVNGKLIQVQFVTPTVGFISAESAYNSIRVRTLSDGSPDLSMVSYDSVTHKNQIIWNKGINFPNRFSPITHYHIYREDAAGAYTRIGELPYDQSGVFIDTSSTPSVKAEKYTLASVDSSGYESPKSPLQQTMFLKSKGSDVTAYQLNWTPWTGSSLNGYLIYQKPLNGTWTKLDSVGPSVNIYSLDGYQSIKASYMIQAIQAIQAIQGVSTAAPDGTTCNPISNIIDFSPAGIEDLNIPAIRIIPNPAQGFITVEIASPPAKGQLTISSITGIELKRLNILGIKNTIDISDMTPGCYILNLHTERIISSVKFVKE